MAMIRARRVGPGHLSRRPGRHKGRAVTAPGLHSVPPEVAEITLFAAWDSRSPGRCPMRRPAAAALTHACGPRRALEYDTGRMNH
eukprot:421892-Hanusia_phi.AAC.1